MRESVAVPAAPPAVAWKLWTSLHRWPTFVEGFAHPVEGADAWPAEGTTLVWQSIPTGRGRVTEKVRECVPGSVLVSDVYEDALTGRQSVRFQGAEAGSRLEIELEYELNSAGPLRVVADVLFIRRALSAALARTLRRFATEAAEDVSL